MKKVIKTLIPIFIASGLLLGCGGKKGDSSASASQEQSSSEQTSASQEFPSSQESSSQEQSSSETSSTIIPSIRVTVNFYIDYNYTHYRVRYYRTYVNNGDLITDVPETPTAPLPEFPNFVGWSTKEVTDDYLNDIWDFANDHVMLTNSDTLNLYGIWSA